MPATPFRKLCAAGFILCLASLAVAVFYMERYLGLFPCPLCILDRLVIMLLALCFLIGFLHNPQTYGQRAYAVSGLLLSAVGITLAGRHIHLQNLPPDKVPDCLPDLDYMLEVFPLTKVFSMVFNSAGECAQISWTFLGLTIPQQTLILFTVLAGINLAILYTSLYRSPPTDNKA